MTTVKKNSLRFGIFGLIFLFVCLVSSSQAVDTLIIPNTNDTFICPDTYTASGISCDPTINYANQTTNYGQLCSVGAVPHVNPIYYKWSNLNITRILTGVEIDLTGASQSSPIFSVPRQIQISNTLNQTWNELNVTANLATGYSARPQVNQSLTFRGSNYTDANYTLFDVVSYESIGNAQFYSQLYNQRNASFVINDVTNPAGCTFNTVGYQAPSHDGGAFPKLNLELADFYTNLTQTTDNSNTLVFDFESGLVSNSFSSFNDFGYDPSTNTLYVSKTKTAIPDFYYTNDNNLASVSCSGLNYLNVTAWGSLNPIILGQQQYDTICFNQSGDHGGQSGWYGIVKIINNTNVRGGSGVDFDFYYALIDPSYSIFSVPGLNPNPPQQFFNLTVTWTTSQSLNTILYYATNNSGTLGSWQTIQNLGNYTFSHQAIINSNNLQPLPYVFYLAGNNTNGVYSTSINYTFTVGTNLNITGGNGTIPKGAQGLADSGFIDSPVTGVYVLGFFILAFFTFWAFFRGGTGLGITIFISGIVVLSTITLLPLYLLIPFIVLSVAIVVIIFRRIFTGGGSD